MESKERARENLRRLEQRNAVTEHEIELAEQLLDGDFFTRFEIVPNPGYHQLQYALDDNYVWEEVRSLLQRGDADYARYLSEIEPYFHSPHLETIGPQQVDEKTPHWNNGFFSELDARTYYGLIAAWKPKRILEMGCGNSTKFARKSIEDHDLETTITCIDPSPRARISEVADTIVTASITEADPALYDVLEAGDIAFFDGSHVSLPGTDVPHYFMNILPRLAPGVIVHIHDIALPREYRREFRFRQYNEQHMLATMLLFSNQWDILLPISHMRMRGLVTGHGGSFWMRRRA